MIGRMLSAGVAQMFFASQSGEEAANTYQSDSVASHVQDHKDNMFAQETGAEDFVEAEHKMELDTNLENDSLNLQESNQVYVDPKTRSIRDPEGRHIIFHGVNVVYKEPPYLPTYESGDKFDKDDSLIPFDMKNLQKWGLNHVRLGVIWEAVETAPGVYNQTYLNEVEELINKMGSYGIYTMVDSH